MTRSLAHAVLSAAAILGFAVADASAAPSPRMLVEITDLSNVAVSPDGRSVAFRQEKASVARNTYDTVWFVQALDGSGAPRPVADGGLPLRDPAGSSVVEPPQWSPDSRWVYFRALLGGQVQVWRASRDGVRAEAVTDDVADVESFAIGGDGRRLIHTVGASREEILRAEDREYDQGIRVDATTPVGQALYRSGFVNGRLATQRYAASWEGWMLRGLLADQPKRQRVVDLATLETNDATDADRAAFAGVMPIAEIKSAAAAESIARQEPGGRVAFLVRNGLDRELHVASDAGSSASVACDAGPCRAADITALAWRPGREEIVFTVTDHERGRAQSLYLWDIPRNAVRSIVHSDGLLNAGQMFGGDGSCAIGGDVAVCVAADANAPPHLVRIDLETGARRTLFEPNRPLLESAGPRAELLTWTDSEGQDFTAWFFPPVVKEPGRLSPLFINYYVCPGYTRGGLGDEWPMASLAGAGIAALCINRARSGQAIRTAVDDYQSALSGVGSVVELLHERGIVDPRRVGMGGLSFGSEVTLWTAMRSDLLSAASVTSPSITPTYHWFNGLKRGMFSEVLKRRWGLGAPEETPEQWRLLSPIHQVDRIDTPILMQMPEQEYLLAMDYFVALVNSGVPAEMYVFPNEPHIKFQPRHKLAAQERNLDWFRFWLQGHQDPDPAKAGQYGIWNGLRQRHGRAPAVARTR